MRLRMLASGISRGTEATVFARAGAGEPARRDAGAADGGRFSVPGEIRLQRRWRHRRGCAHVRAASAPGSLQRAGGNVHSGARRDSDAARRARRQHGNRAQHPVGCRTAGRRTRDGDRRRRGRVAHRFTAGPDSGDARYYSRCRSRARRLGTRLRLRLRACRRGALRAGTCRACLGQRRRIAPGTAMRRVRGTHRRGELVRRSRAASAAGRGVPSAPAAADRLAGRQHRRTDARATQLRRTPGHRTGAARQCRLRRAAGTGYTRSRICRA